MSDFEYQDVRRIKTEDGAYFVPVCKDCGRFVKPYEELVFDGHGQPIGPNATCSQHGEISMLFEGYYE